MKKLPPPKQMNFLVVDDMDNMRKSIRAMLKLINYGDNILEAADGKEAWEVLEQSTAPIHFIISDWNMPVMTGTDLLNRVRGSSKFRDTPFLMVTADANKEIVAEAAENDVDAYLTKPFVTATLEKKLNELIHNANNPDPVTRHLIEAREFTEKNKYDEAIESLKKASKLNPKTSRPLREMGIIYLKQNNIKMAMKCFQKATDINMLDVTSFHYLGQLCYKSGQLDKAIEYFSVAMDISPRHSDRAMKFATLLLKKKKNKEAEKILGIILQNNINDFEIKEQVADICYENGLYKMASGLLQEILNQNAERHEIHRKMGISLRKLGKTKEALPFLEKAAEQFTEDVEVFLELATAYLKMEKIVPAEKWSRKVLDIEADNKLAKEILDRCL